MNGMIEEIAGFLLNRKVEVVFVFGAGASYSSGIPLSSELKERRLDRLRMLKFNSKVRQTLKDVGVDNPGGYWDGLDIDNITFEQLMTVSVILREEETDEGKDKAEKAMTEWLGGQIPDIYKSDIKYFPSFSYEFTSHLVSIGLVKYIVNMNYDELLDKAIDDEIGRGRCYKVVTLEDFETLRIADERENWSVYGDCFLFKPHGTISRPRSCRYRVEYIKTYDEDKRKVLGKVFQDSVCVLVGYRASDEDFRSLLANLPVDEDWKKIYIVNPEPEAVNLNLGGRGIQITCDEEQFVRKLADALYGEGTIGEAEYKRLYTKGTRHLVRASTYKYINPINADKLGLQKKIMKYKNDPAFFERINLILEILIFCFKVRGLFTRQALSSCPRIVSALEMYLAKASGEENPIENILQTLTEQGMLSYEPLGHFEGWFYIPYDNNELAPELFANCAEEAAKIILNELQDFIEENAVAEFVNDIKTWLVSLPSDFDYDLLKGPSTYFLPLNNIVRFTERKQFREKTEELLDSAKELGNLNVMSPSVAEWLLNWVRDLGDEKLNEIKILVNNDMLKIEESIHYHHTIGTVEELEGIIQYKIDNEQIARGGVRRESGIEYGLTLVYEEMDSGGLIGKAILFERSGKASSFSPILIEENEPTEGSDIEKLKSYFDEKYGEDE